MRLARAVHSEIGDRRKEPSCIQHSAALVEHCRFLSQTATRGLDLPKGSHAADEYIRCSLEKGDSTSYNIEGRGLSGIQQGRRDALRFPDVAWAAKAWGKSLGHHHYPQSINWRAGRLLRGKIRLAFSSFQEWQLSAQPPLTHRDDNGGSLPYRSVVTVSRQCMQSALNTWTWNKNA